MIITARCPLCVSDSIKTFSKANEKLYYRCDTCGLIFMAQKFFLSRKEEKLRYETHNNDPNDQRYIEHLKKLTDPLQEYLKPGMKGLDYGCGEGKPISHILGQKGFVVKNYDPFFFEDKNILKGTYDFITCTETAEHFYNPVKEFDRLVEMLKQDGILAMMTNFYSDEMNFDEWWYTRDPTHVVFYSKQTFDWICANYNLIVVLVEKDVILLKKQ